MPDRPLANLLLEQSKDLIWIIDSGFCLKYANQAYQNVMKQVTGEEKKNDESIFTEGFGDGYIEKWKAYYERGLKGEHFEIEEHFYNATTNQVEYSQISFKPLTDENQAVVNVACQSRDITSFVKSNTEAEILLDASLDVICSIDEQGNFTKVSAACKSLWGYEKHELIGKAYIGFVIEEDIEKTNLVAADIIAGKDFTTFENRYKRKDGGIAFNLWSAKWDPKTQIMFCVARDGREKIKKEELLIESEKALRQSEARLKGIIDSQTNYVIRIDLQGNYSYYNQKYLDDFGWMYGTENTSLLGLNCMASIMPYHLQNVNNVIQKCFSSPNQVFQIEIDKPAKDNGVKNTLWDFIILTDSEGRPDEVQCSGIDISERIKAEKDTKEANQRFELINEATFDTIWDYNLIKQTLYWGANFKLIFGYNIAGLQSDASSWTENIHPEDSQRIADSLNKAIKGSDDKWFEEYRFRNSDLSYAYVVIKALIVRDEDGNALRMLGAIQDITKKKAEEQHLKLLESVITNTNDAVLITEAEPFDYPGPRILYVNEAFTRMTGYTAEEVIGKTPRILQGPNSDMAELARLSKAIRNWEPCEITTINYKKNGEEFWINFSLTPVADETGWYTHWISIERDVTEQKTKELENELVVQISSTFNLVNDFEKATKKLCEIIGLYGKLDWVELWTPNLEKTKMRLMSHYVITPEDEIFYTDNYHDNKFTKDEGLIGKVWASGKQILWDDVTKSKEFIRADAAKKIGLKSVLGIPLIFNNEVLGVLTVGVKSNSDYLKNYTRTFERLEKFIGSELQRKTIEIELGLLFDTIPDIISVGDFQGRFLRINKPGCELLGYSEEEILNKGFENFIHPEDLNICYEEIQKLQNGQDTFGFEVRFKTKSGEILWLSWYCKAKINEGLIYCTAKNITEEKKLRELNRQTRKLAKIGSWEVDLLNQSIYWSDEVHQMHETDASAFKPTMEQAIAFYREDFRELVNQCIEKSINTGAPFDFEAVLVTANKKELWVRAIGNVAFVNGKCTSIYGSFQDIHERKEAEIRLQSLADNIPGTIFQYQLFPDGTDKLLHLSKGAETLWGIEAELGMKNNALIWDQIIAGGDIDKVQASIGESMNSLANWHVNFRSKLPNGKMKWLEGLGTPSRLSDGSTIWDSIILDVTNLKETEQLLASASKLARVGSWELVLQDNEEHNMFWSSMTKNILEIDEAFVVSLAYGLSLHKEPSRSMVEAAMNKLIKTGEAFDLELELVSAKGNDVWVRCIGDAQFESGKVTRIYGSFQDINTRKLAELKQLKLIEEKNNILESIGDAFFAVDKNWVVNYWNHAAESVLRKKKDDIVGKNVWNEFADAIDTDFYTKYHLAMETMETQSFEAFYETTNQWLEVTAYPSVDGLSVYFKDITQRKLANAEIAKSEEKRRLIMNGALDAIISIDTNETINFWNPQAEAIFGWKAEEVMGKPLSEIIIPEPFRKYHVEGLKNYLKTGEGKALNVLLELSAIRRNGEEFPIELTVIPIKQGGEEFFCAFIRDISQRKKAERELIENENYLRTILDNEPECVKVLNSKGELLSMNPAGLAMIEADNEQQVLGHRMSDLVDKEYQLGFNRLSKEVFKGNSGSFEFEITGLKGGCRWLETHAVPLKDTAGKIVNLLGVTRDITQRKKAEKELLGINEKLSIQTKELQRSNEELEQFAFITSHDLQEPLRMISSFMDQLKRKYADRLDEKGLQYIHFATDGAKRMKQIILDLLLYSRANKPTEQNELINFNEIVSEYTQLRRKVIAEKKAIITYHGLPSIETYRAPITQIFHCLLDNALKYMAENTPPSIEIVAIEKENVWQFAIKDNGIGIDPQFFDKIFIIFQRLQNRKEHDGSGIGLAIAKRSIEFLGGEIWVESEKDKGSTFYFTIFKIKQDK